MSADFSAKSRAGRDFAVFAAIAVVLLLVRLTFLHEPFERDEGFYSTIAQVILDGGVPYRDAIDMKPPGVFYIYAVAISLFGKTVESIRIFTAVYSLFTLAGVYLLGRIVAGSIAGLIAAAIYALFSGAPLAQGSSSNSEVFLVLPLVLSACFFLGSRDRRPDLFLFASGIFAGLALLIKTVAAPYLLLLFAAIFFLRRGWKERFRGAVLFVTPIFALVGLTVAYFAARGALADFMHFNVTLPFLYSKGGAGISGLPLPTILPYLMPEYLMPVLVAVPTMVWLLIAGNGLKDRIAALLLPASFAAALMPGMNFPHYFIQTVPFLAVLCGIGFARLYEMRRMLVFNGAVVVAVAAFVFYVYTDYRYFFVMTPEQVSVVKYGNDFAASVYIADYIKQRTSPGDYIFQWGFEPELYFLTDRRPPVGFISSTIPEIMPDPDQAVRLMIDRLQATRTKYIVFQRDWAEWKGLDEIRALLAREYHVETAMGYALIFKRNE